MKTITTAMALMLMLLLPFGANAQTPQGGLFNTDFYNDQTERQGMLQNRDAVITWTLTNQTFGQDASLGSGLAILLAAGAGYTVVRRKRSRKNMTLLIALVALLGFTQCKKDEPQEPQSGGNVVRITLNVGGSSDNGSRADVNTGTGAVTYEDGDEILVVSDGKYIGTLTCSGAAFSGTITGPVEGQPLYFYFLGNKDTGTLTAGTTTSCTVNISDQTSKLPVISMAPSTENYTSSKDSYEACLLNKCSLMKFNVTTPSNSPICITGMNNKVTVLFNDRSVNDGFSYSVDGTDGGLIKMAGGSGSPAEKWAIVLPQSELAAGSAGSIYAQSGTYTTFTGSRPLIHAIEANGYYHEGDDAISMTVNTATNIIDLGDVTVNTEIATGKTLIGTLAGEYQISIADGASVTLDNATINGVNSWDYEWAGITCLGDATIILEGTNTVKGFQNTYPGIQAAYNDTGVGDEYTLTIQGTGSLTASSNGRAAGIGGGPYIECGNITISGGTITATGGDDAAGIGSGEGRTCGNITISNGTVTATGGSNAAGIGTGGAGASCGNISISGGIVTATGGSKGAGIGTGKGMSCGNITITSDVTIITATKGSGASNSIGMGYQGTCGTVTIGGVEGAISTSPYTYEPLPEGALSGKFTINGSGDQVYFSQGNLKYSAGTWSFHTNQYDMCFTSEGSVSANYTSSGTFDLFGYGTSGYNDKYPYMTDMNGSYYYDDLTGSTGSNYDWGVHNTISNGGTGWRTPTINEWDYLLNHRVTSSNVRYAKATVNGVAGLIILPDDWSTGYYNLSSVANSANSSFNETNITLSEWSSALEAHGAVFLPVFSYREGTTVVDIVGYTSFYWSSTYYGSVYGPDFYGANCLSLAEYEYDQNVYSYVATDFPGPLYDGHFVRLVKDAN